MRDSLTATARAYSNIAFIKYWGNVDDELRLPANSSLSMNLAELHTTTTVRWSKTLSADHLTINGTFGSPAALQRTARHLHLIRDRFGISHHAEVRSSNNFPMGTGIASSASAFAALSLAAVAALGESMSERELSALARRGSGSAARSIPAGFAQWHAGDSDETSYAVSIAEPDHWDLVDIIAVVSRIHKEVDSTSGHATANSSILQAARVNDAACRLDRARQAMLERDFAQLALVVEEDSNLMHAVMMTSRPPLFYWKAISLDIMLAVQRWRQRDGLHVCYTLDAGPNVHCICEKRDADAVIERLAALHEEIEIFRSAAGPGAHLIEGGSARP